MFDQLAPNNPRRLIEIPPTSRKTYISGDYALNLIFPDELTGDWHFYELFNPRHPKAAVDLAGEGQRVNTNPMLGDLGIRDVGVLLSPEFVPPGSEVYAANHYRAIVDSAYSSVLVGLFPLNITNRLVNDYLNTLDEVEELKQTYARPLVSGTSGQEHELLSEWFATLDYDDGC